jgi:hypothetical protein
MTQQATLERWYTYCQEALGMVDAGSQYAKRIQVEALFPEYAFLVFGSTYTTNARWSSSSKTYSGTVTSTRGSSSVFTRSYQQFYNHAISLNVLDPSEFYDYNSGSASTEKTLDYITTVARASIYTYGMYYSWCMNWGVTF